MQILIMRDIAIACSTTKKNNGAPKFDVHKYNGEHPRVLHKHNGEHPRALHKYNGEHPMALHKYNGEHPTLMRVNKRWRTFIKPLQN